MKLEEAEEAAVDENDIDADDDDEEDEADDDDGADAAVSMEGKLPIPEPTARAARCGREGREKAGIC